MKMELESSGLVQRALRLIDDTKKIATQIVVNRADFLMLAYFLMELRPLLEELNKQQDLLTARSSWPSLQRLTNVVEAINTFTKSCSSRSRIFILCHSNDLVNDMIKYFEQLAECLNAMLTESFEVPPAFKELVVETREKVKGAGFFQEPGHAELAREIASSLIQCQSDEQVATGLLQRIAEHLNVPALEVSELKLELQRDLKAAESEGRQTDIQELKGLCALLDPAQVLDDRRRLVCGDSPLHPMGTFEIPKPFFCPITKELMREPVMLEEGHTYERTAILEWFDRGNRTCPDTGQELQSLDLMPNVKLQQAMDEFFSNMYKGQLIHALQELRTQGTVLELEAAINTVKAILDVDPKYRRLMVSLDGVRPLVTVLKPSVSQIRERILRILYNVALLGDEYKLSIIEAEAIPVLLRILQKSPGENGGPVQLLWELSKCEAGLKAILFEKGSILIIVSAFNLCQNDQKLLAEKLLGNLCVYDESVIIEAARSSLFGPLVTSLSTGNEATRLKMATVISTALELNDHSSSALVKAGVVPPLLSLLQHGLGESKLAASRALHRLSSTDMNKIAFAKAGAIPILVKFLDTPTQQLKVDVMAVLSNLATDRQNATEIDQEGAVVQRLGMLLTGDTLMQEYSLKTLECMARDSHTVRASLMELKMVPNIYRLLIRDGLSNNCRASILNLLCHLAEDRSTRQALSTSREMVKFLIGLIEGNIVGEEKEAVLGLLAGLAKIDEMKRQMLVENQLPLICAEHLKPKGNPKLQESAAVILSRLSEPALIGKSVQMTLARQGLILSLMEVISQSASTERAKQHATVTLGHFSKCTPGLSQRQYCVKRLLATLGFKKYKICRVHAGKCDVRRTFCIVEAGAVPLLINLVKEGGPWSAEQAVETLSTLIAASNGGNMQRGVDFLVNNGIMAPLVSLVGKTDLSTEKAAKLMELIFRIKKYRDEQHSKSAKASLATILATGNSEARKFAATALMHLKEMPRDSTYKDTTST